MKAANIALRVAELVSGDRERTHGSKLRNFQNITVLWNAYLKIRTDPEAELTPIDHANMMVLLKVARTQLGDFNLEDFIDQAGYAACGGEVATVLNEPPAEEVAATISTLTTPARKKKRKAK